MWRFDNGQPISLGVTGATAPWGYAAGNPDQDGTLKVNPKSQWFTNGYFANANAVLYVPPPYTIGNASRMEPNTRIPGTKNATLSVFKEFGSEQDERRLQAAIPRGSVQCSQPSSIWRHREYFRQRQFRGCHQPGQFTSPSPVGSATLFLIQFGFESQRRGPRPLLFFALRLCGGINRGGAEALRKKGPWGNTLRLRVSAVE